MKKGQRPAKKNSKKESSEKPQKDELKEWESKYLYLQAEFENYKKRMAREKGDWLKFSGESLSRDLLVILDHFHNALNIPLKPENLDSFYKGLEMILSEYLNILQSHGVKEISVREKDSFDSSLHEAVEARVSKADGSGKILQVLKKGYALHEKILRPAQVIVSKEK